jgi:hypothetical protein
MCRYGVTDAVPTRPFGVAVRYFSRWLSQPVAKSAPSLVADPRVVVSESASFPRWEISLPASLAPTFRDPLPDPTLQVRIIAACLLQPFVC